MRRTSHQTKLRLLSADISGGTRFASAKCELNQPTHQVIAVACPALSHRHLFHSPRRQAQDTSDPSCASPLCSFRIPHSLFRIPYFRAGRRLSARRANHMSAQGQSGAAQPRSAALGRDSSRIQEPCKGVTSRSYARDVTVIGQEPGPSRLQHETSPAVAAR